MIFVVAVVSVCCSGRMFETRYVTTNNKQITHKRVVSKHLTDRYLAGQEPKSREDFESAYCPGTD